jgi:hypothetical protein
MRRLVLASVVAAALWPGGRSAAAPAEAELYPAVGQVLAPFTAEGVDGATREISYAKGSTTVLMFFLSSCPTCHRMLPEWNRAWERRPKGLTVVAVMLDREPPGWFTINPVAFPVVRSPSRAFLDSYRVHRVPVTLRVAAGGRVEEVATGIVDPIRLGELFRAPD